MRITKTDPSSAVMPITLDDLKQHLKVEDEDEDALIQIYLRTAVQQAEDETRRAIARQPYLVTADDYLQHLRHSSGTGRYWPLPLGFVQSVTQIEYRDNQGATQVWPSSQYEVDTESQYQSRLKPVSNASWPSTGSYLSSFRISLVAGWTADDCPDTIKQAIRMLASNLFESRAPGDPEGDAIDSAAKMLLKPWSLPFFAS